MPRFVVWVVAKEIVTYKHVIDADSEEQVRQLFEDGELLDDSGSWSNTETEDHSITQIEVLT